MKRNRRIQKLGDILGDWVRTNGVQGPMARGQVMATWEAILSPQMQQQISRTWVKGDKLFVRVESSVWRHELHARREDWRRRLNEELGAESIKEIVFR